MEQGLAACVVRTKPLGCDRRHARYWWLAGMVSDCCRPLAVPVHSIKPGSAARTKGYRLHLGQADCSCTPCTWVLHKQQQQVLMMHSSLSGSWGMCPE